MEVLIIEDDASIAELQRDYLEIAGYEVSIASDGETGLELAQNGVFDLIIVDIMLPKMGGFEVCREIRKTKETPILVVSAKTTDIDKVRALGLGADDYMTKPFSPNELVARVNAHIKRYQRLSQMNVAKNDKKNKREIIVGQIKMILSSRKVEIGGSEIFLTNKEFDLLLFLAQNMDIVLSKEELLRKVWGIDVCVETATVAVHINRLREKVEKNPSDPRYIQTVWGIGYRFVIP